MVKPSPGEQDGQKDGQRLVAEMKIGDTSIRVYRPEISEEERRKRMKMLYRAIVNCYNSQG
ncbi:MAG: hypothetical protein XD63_0504 [Thermoanaerobacterales bacterium 50_218]|nr:MAG: hypothetical protein XD63_0504 [Thermoanaerobacterales bacterium 50_218]